MIHITCTPSLACGTVNSSTPVIATRGAESKSHGRAFPCFVLVRSMT